jgi:hypothetical protein
MKRKLTLRIEDVQVSSFAAEAKGGVHGAALYTQIRCYSQTGCPGGPLCVTQEYGGGDTCETGPVYYC